MRPRIVSAAVAATVLVVAAGVLVVVNLFDEHLPLTVDQLCEVSTATGSVNLAHDQMANAATIAAIGLRRKLPERAVVVALATALQESKLRNLSGGDRDSVGLFQQRPSQGWGTASQISDPRFAARRFYGALVRVEGWAEMRVTEAAQRVQRSAYPEAYEKWADEAAVLTEALTGQAGGAVSCAADEPPTVVGEAAARALDTGLRLDWGKVETVGGTDVLGLVVAVGTDRRGWQFAHWLVAHSAQLSVQRVRFGDHEWRSDGGDWSRLADGGGGERVVAEVYRT
jgi:hypothetical protein